MPKNGAKSDFNPQELTQKTDKHEQDITRLFEWASQMEGSFGSNEKIAKTLHGVAQSSVEMNTILQEVLIHLIQKDPDVKSEVKKLVQDIDRSAVHKLWKRIGWATWTIFTAVAGVIVGYLLSNLNQPS